MKAYLLALEIAPIAIGKTYESLPLHCTLMHWFRIDAIDDFIQQVHVLVGTKAAPELHIEEPDDFTGITKTGVISVKVNKVRKTDELNDLHEAIATIAESLGVEYVMPQYIHTGYVPHVTHQGADQLSSGDEVRVTSLYIAEAASPEYGYTRRVVCRFTFKDEN